VERWLVAYDVAGISSDKVPPPAVVDLVASVDVAVASDLPRCVASAARLWPERPIETSPLFREIPLRIPSFSRARMPLSVWSLCIHIQWALDIVSGRDLLEHDQQRVDEAAEWCERTCRQHGPDAVLAVITHGVFRRAIAQRLVKAGWQLGGSRRYVPWSVWTVTHPGVPIAPAG
jgi:hypothetical protein